MGQNLHDFRCKILPVVWTRAQFQHRHGCITSFAKQLIKKNFPASIDVDREDVEHHWWLLVDKVFPKGDRDREPLMSQARCPDFHEFWVERDRQNGIVEQGDNEGFQRAQRPTMRAERSAFPGVVILVKNGREILLPGIDFTRLTNVKYRTLVRQILEANQGSQITLPEMQLLWDAVVHKLFGFECACVKEAKANESMGIDGFSQTQYNQLLLDVRSGVPPPRPTLVVKLPIPRSKRPRTTKATDSSSETGNNEVGTTEDDSPTAQKQKRRSKRQDCSGPADRSSTQDQPSQPSASRSVFVPNGYLSTTAAKSAAEARIPSGPETEWLDPRLLSEPPIQAVDRAVATSFSMSKALESKELGDVGGEETHKYDIEEEVGAWSL